MFLLPSLDSFLADEANNYLGTITIEANLRGLVCLLKLSDVVQF
jgi:hypothetical protein